MNDEIPTGTSVRTAKPARVFSGWSEADRASRRWHANGEVVRPCDGEQSRPDGHPRYYVVEHKDDGSRALYERRELQRLDVREFTKAEREALLDRMQALSDSFYSGATSIGVHAYIEFCGLMNEFVTICRSSDEMGIDFTMANTHNNKPLVMASHHGAYLGEKLGCIYGPTLRSDPAVRRAFVSAAFGGEFTLIALPGRACSEPPK
jgi:hypothetical protein